MSKKKPPTPVLVIARCDAPVPPLSWFEDSATFEHTAGCGWREVFALLAEYKDFVHRVMSDGGEIRTTAIAELRERTEPPALDGSTLADLLAQARAECAELRRRLAVLEQAPAEPAQTTDYPHDPAIPTPRGGR